MEDASKTGCGKQNADKSASKGRLASTLAYEAHSYLTAVIESRRSMSAAPTVAAWITDADVDSMLAAI